METWCGQTFSKTNAGDLAEWGTLLRIFKLELKLLVEGLNFKGGIRLKLFGLARFVAFSHNEI